MLTPYRGDLAQTLLYKIAVNSLGGGAPPGSGVASFNGRSGTVTLLSSDVTGALGFTPLSQGAGDARYVLKTGDTMTGALAVGDGGTTLFSVLPATPEVTIGGPFIFLPSFTIFGTDANGDPYTQFRFETEEAPLLGKVGFFGATPATRQNATDSESVHTALVTFGLITGSWVPPTSGETEKWAYRDIAAEEIFGEDDRTINCTSGTFDVHLPQVTNPYDFRVFCLKNSGAGVITLLPDGTDTIDGLGSATLAAGVAITVQSDNDSNWVITARNP